MKDKGHIFCKAFFTLVYVIFQLMLSFDFRFSMVFFLIEICLIMILFISVRYFKITIKKLIVKYLKETKMSFLMLSVS